jgi:tetratricopeptide (TPR) repeat protein
VARAGKSFKRFAPGFTLESDTPLQRAARAFFGAIPGLIKETSRVIRHHEARYHMHVIHACGKALDQPQTTTLTKDQVQAILDDEYVEARTLLEKAVEIRSAYEPDKNIYNTFALLLFDYADATLQRNHIGSGEEYSDRFSEAVDLQEKAMGEDPTDGLARYQFAHRIFQSVPASDLSDTDKLALYARAELRFEELIKLHQERRVRNIDPIDAEVQLSMLYQNYRAAMAQIPSVEATLAAIVTKNPEAALILRIREALGLQSLRDGFNKRETADVLRSLRNELHNVPNKTARGLLYLYRLYTEDPAGRLE